MFYLCVWLPSEVTDDINSFSNERQGQTSLAGSFECLKRNIFPLCLSETIKNNSWKCSWAIFPCLATPTTLLSHCTQITGDAPNRRHDGDITTLLCDDVCPKQIEELQCRHTLHRHTLTAISHSCCWRKDTFSLRNFALWGLHTALSWELQQLFLNPSSAHFNGSHNPIQSVLPLRGRLFVFAPCIHFIVQRDMSAGVGL